MEIRKINIPDVEKLREISIRTFTETFAAENSEENMSNYLKEGLSTERLKNELSNPESEFYFAELDGKVIGYIKINFGQAQSEIIDDAALEIERIYVLREFHGENIGQTLYQKAIDLAHERNLECAWLGVWEHNPRAIRFYEKNGFVAFDKHIFKLGDDNQTDIMMKLKLK